MLLFSVNSLPTPSAILNNALFTVGESDITLGKLGGAVLLSALGYLLAKVISTRIGKKLERRSELPKGASAAYQALVFYALIALSVLLALAVVEIPLTIFTLFGGALAIGVGFGSQNLVNNFISGLILLLERPVRVGDIIEISGGRGTVIEIGARKTRIRQVDGLELIVPNSKLLEQPFVNWTLSDQNIRSTIQIGLPLSTDPRKVQSILLDSLQGFREVLSQPAPVVTLSNIKDGILEFTITYWISLQDLASRSMLESDARITLLEGLRKHGIEAALPQRETRVASV